MSEAPVTQVTAFPELSALTAVSEFHEMFEVPVLEDGPRVPATDRCNLRIALLQEELDELESAMKALDLVECADALADLQYVLVGAVLEFGLHRQFKMVFDEVHRSNMTKACTTQEEAKATLAHYKSSKGVEAEIRQRETPGGKFLVNRLPDGKCLKSVQYSPPQLRSVIELQKVESVCTKASAGIPEPSCLTSVAAFHTLFYGPVADDCPSIPSADSCSLQVALLQEELDELKAAIGAKDIVECADALADIQYVLSWAVLEFGLHHRFEAIFAEVHRSNMSKACSTRDEAEATVKHYARSKHVVAEIKESAFAAGSFLVNRLPDKKVLKSVLYSPPQLHCIVFSRRSAQNDTETPQKVVTGRLSDRHDLNESVEKRARTSVNLVASQ